MVLLVVLILLLHVHVQQHTQPRGCRPGASLKHSPIAQVYSSSTIACDHGATLEGAEFVADMILGAQ